MESMKLPALYTSGTRKSIVSSSQAAPDLYMDDIDCLAWLSEVGLPQYEEVFLLNFTKGGSSMLSRSRLGQVRLRDFPSMNIEDFGHQKTLLEHIRLALQFQFHSPQRKDATSLLASSVRKATAQAAPESARRAYGISASAHPGSAIRPHRRVLAAPARRRRSFDRHVWQSVAQLRTTVHHHSETNQSRRRSLSIHFEPAHVPLSVAEKGVKYGNLSQVFDGIKAEMVEMRDTLLRELRIVLECERVELLFIDPVRREIIVFSRGSWYSRPLSCGLAGYCAESAAVLAVLDVDVDVRYEAGLDEHLHQKTTSVLCVPVRGHMGGRDVMAVLQCCNKHGGFTDIDIERAEETSMRISEVLGSRMAVLALVPEALSGGSIFVGPQTGRAGGGWGRQHHFDDGTANSVAYKNALKGPVAHEEAPLHFKSLSRDELDAEKVKLHRRQNYR